TSIPISVALGLLLIYMTFRREKDLQPARSLSGDSVADAAGLMSRSIRRVGVALAAEKEDAPMLAEAITLARTHGAELLLVHIVEGVGGQYHAQRGGDVDFHHDDQYLPDLVVRLRRDLDGSVSS